MWGEWRTEGMPSLGDYIQVEGRLKCTAERAREQGVVTSVRGSAVSVSPMRHCEGCLRARRWRLWHPPEIVVPIASSLRRQTDA